MRNTANQLLKAAEAAGYSFKVMGFEGYEEGIIDYQGTSAAKAFEATKLEGAANVWLSKEGSKTEWASIIHFNDPDESLSDCTAEGWINDWAERTNFGQED